jgi:hypothetical protein
MSNLHNEKVSSLDSLDFTKSYSSDTIWIYQHQDQLSSSYQRNIHFVSEENVACNSIESGKRTLTTVYFNSNQMASNTVCKRFWKSLLPFHTLDVCYHLPTPSSSVLGIVLSSLSAQACVYLTGAGVLAWLHLTLVGKKSLEGRLDNCKCKYRKVDINRTNGVTL